MTWFLNVHYFSDVTKWNEMFPRKEKGRILIWFRPSKQGGIYLFIYLLHLLFWCTDTESSSKTQSNPSSPSQILYSSMVSLECVLSQQKKKYIARILQIITCNSVFYSGSEQDYCCFKERRSPNGLWSDRSYINRLFALSTDAIITNYFQALWELNNFVMHHWTFSCFASRWFQGSICSQQCFQQAPFTFTKRFRSVRIFIPHHRCLSWSLPIHRQSGSHSQKDRGGFWNVWLNLLCIDYFCQHVKIAAVLGNTKHQVTWKTAFICQG